MFRLLLEYARIIDDNRDQIGYSGDGSELDKYDVGRGYDWALHSLVAYVQCADHTLYQYQHQHWSEGVGGSYIAVSSLQPFGHACCFLYNTDAHPLAYSLIPMRPS